MGGCEDLSLPLRAEAHMFFAPTLPSPVRVCAAFLPRCMARRPRPGQSSQPKRRTHATQDRCCLRHTLKNRAVPCWRSKAMGSFGLDLIAEEKAGMGRAWPRSVCFSLLGRHTDRGSIRAAAHRAPLLRSMRLVPADKMSLRHEADVIRDVPVSHKMTAGRWGLADIPNQPAARRPPHRSVPYSPAARENAAAADKTANPHIRLADIPASGPEKLLSCFHSPHP